ncbi:MAG: type II secretion system protein [Candidatus Omnitrophica bacterium]|nr:type II secretion system protein [Candidatus Omnitrophota bacterium]
MNKKKHKSFTLIELILVVAIVAMLAGAMMPVISSARSRARVAKILLIMEALETAGKKYYSDTGRAPIENSARAHESELSVNSAVSSIPWSQPLAGQPIPGWDGPYIDKPLSNDSTPYRNGLGIDFRSPPGGIIIVHFYAYGVPENDARMLNQALDSNEPGSWDGSGEVTYQPLGKMVDINLFRIKL